MEQTDITQTIMDAINHIFETILNSINNNLYEVLDKITFINEDILTDSNFEKIFGTSASNGILLIANSLLLGFLLYYGIKFLFSHLTYTKTENPFSFLIKLMLCGICMNFSYFLVSEFLNIFSAISVSIRELGKVLFGKTVCFSELIKIIDAEKTQGSTFNIFSLDGLLNGSISISLLSLIFTYSMRYILVKIFALLAPFAILSACTESTAWFFKSWFRNLFSLAFIQIIVALVLVLLFSMDASSNNLFAKFVYIGGIYALLKANTIVREFVGGVSTSVAQSVDNIVNLRK